MFLFSFAGPRKTSKMIFHFFSGSSVYSWQFSNRSQPKINVCSLFSVLVFFFIPRCEWKRSNDGSACPFFLILRLFSTSKNDAKQKRKWGEREKNELHWVLWNSILWLHFSSLHRHLLRHLRFAHFSIQFNFVWFSLRFVALTVYSLDRFLFAALFGLNAYARNMTLWLWPISFCWWWEFASSYEKMYCILNVCLCVKSIFTFSACRCCSLLYTVVVCLRLHFSFLLFIRSLLHLYFEFLCLGSFVHFLCFSVFHYFLPSNSFAAIQSVMTFISVSFAHSYTYSFTVIHLLSCLLRFCSRLSLFSSLVYPSTTTTTTSKSESILV